MKLMFLPGVSGDGTFWAPVARRLLAESTTRFVDWPGLGPIPASLTVSSFDDLVDLVIDQLRTDPSVLIAQSMGGVVAVNVAIRHPELVTGLVLCATSGGVDMTAFGAESWHDNYRRRWPDAPAWVYERPPDLTPALRQLAMPTLLLWATRDPISPLAVGTRLHAIIPNSTLRTIDTDDHTFATRQPEWVAPQIVAFLDTIGRP
jgi:poly(3-hydroxyoctanoate) depolymerase